MSDRKKRATRLRNLRLDGVHLVDKGAQGDHARVLLYKRDASDDNNTAQERQEEHEMSTGQYTALMKSEKLAKARTSDELWDVIEDAAGLVARADGEVTKAQAIDELLKTADGAEVYNRYIQLKKAEEFGSGESSALAAALEVSVESGILADEAPDEVRSAARVVIGWLTSFEVAAGGVTKSVAGGAGGGAELDPISKRAMELHPDLSEPHAVTAFLGTEGGAAMYAESVRR